MTSFVLRQKSQDVVVADAIVTLVQDSVLLVGLLTMGALEHLEEVHCGVLGQDVV